MRRHEAAAGTLVDRMKARGLRLTGQRRVLAELLDESRAHLDAETVFRLARQRDPSIHRATVYRTLNTLKRLGLVDELDLMHVTGERHFYEVRPSTLHIHLVCTSCGEVEEPGGSFWEDLKRKVERETGFKPTVVRLETGGVARDAASAIAGARTDVRFGRGEGMATTVQELIRKHRPLWNVTTRNPFVKGVRDGTMERESFDRWLIQARHLLEGHYAPVCRLLAAAPREDRPLLLQALEIIHAETEWHRQRIVERGLDPAARVHPVISVMANYLVALGFQPYVVGLVAFWTQGRTYVDAWKTRSPASGTYREFLLRFHQPRGIEWGRRMDRAANRALAGASASERDAAEQAFLRVMNDKLQYWTMTLS